MPLKLFSAGVPRLAGPRHWNLTGLSARRPQCFWAFQLEQEVQQQREESSAASFFQAVSHIYNYVTKKQSAKQQRVPTLPALRILWFRSHSGASCCFFFLFKMVLNLRDRAATEFVVEKRRFELSLYSLCACYDLLCFWLLVSERICQHFLFLFFSLTESWGFPSLDHFRNHLGFYFFGQEEIHGWSCFVHLTVNCSYLATSEETSWHTAGLNPNFLKNVLR